jgi:hypothetical protein
LAATVLRPSVASPQARAEGSPDEGRLPRGAESERAAPPRPVSGEAIVPLLLSPPDADDDDVTTFKSEPAFFNVLANDTSATGDSLFMDEDPEDPPNGSVVCELATGDCTYTPDPGFSGNDSFEYSVSDGGLLSSTATVTIHVVNRPPNAVNDTAETLEDNPVTIDVLANDTDPDGDAPDVTGVGPALHGITTLNLDDTITYSPNSGYTGPDGFSYTISDGDGGTDTGTVAITVRPPNRPPVAVNDSASTAHDTPVVIDVLGNDTDLDGDVLTVNGNAPATEALNGHADCSAGTSCTYTPNTGFTGNDQFTYVASDGQATSNTATVLIKVTNDPPNAVDDSTTTQKNVAKVVSVLANDSDPDGDALTVTSAGPAGHGTVTVNAGTTVTYTPMSNFVGPDTFPYSISDGHGGTDTATVFVTVSDVPPPPNQPPNAVNDSTTTQKNVAKVVSMLANDSDPDGDPLTVTSAGPAGHGTVTINAGTTVTYTPSTDFVGTDSFSYSISDGRGGTDTATVSVTVSDAPPPVNRPPNAVNDAASTPAGQTRTLNVLANDTDPDGDPLSITSVSDPPHGTAAAAGGGNVSYTPDVGFTGADTFTYAISDGQGGTDNATVTITVTAVANQPPSAVINSPGGDVTIAPGQTVNFTGTGTDPDGTIVAFAWAFPGGTPASSAVEDPGSVTFAAAGVFTVTFNVVDNSGASDPTPAQRTIHVEEGGGGGDPLDVDRSSPGSDGRVDGHDVLFVLRAIESQDPRGDVNGDGRVDREDVDLVLEALGDTR